MPFSFNIVLLLTVSLLIVRSAAGDSIQTGLCGDRESGGATPPSSSCLELEEGETCLNADSHESDWTDTCSEVGACVCESCMRAFVTHLDNVTFTITSVGQVYFDCVLIDYGPSLQLHHCLVVLAVAAL